MKNLILIIATICYSLLTSCDDCNSNYNPPIVEIPEFFHPEFRIALGDSMPTDIGLYGFSIQYTADIYMKYFNHYKGFPVGTYASYDSVTKSYVVHPLSYTIYAYPLCQSKQKVIGVDLYFRTAVQDDTLSSLTGVDSVMKNVISQMNAMLGSPDSVVCDTFYPNNQMNPFRDQYISKKIFWKNKTTDVTGFLKFKNESNLSTDSKPVHTFHSQTLEISVFSSKFREIYNYKD